MKRHILLRNASYLPSTPLNLLEYESMDAALRLYRQPLWATSRSVKQKQPVPQARTQPRVFKSNWHRTFNQENIPKGSLLDVQRLLGLHTSISPPDVVFVSLDFEGVTNLQDGVPRITEVGVSTLDT